MRRGRGKGKKPTVVTAMEDPGSVEDEKLPANRRRGRLQKSLEDDTKKGREAAKIEEACDDLNGSVSLKSTENVVVASENGKKRKSSTQAKEIIEIDKHENDIELKSINDDSAKPVGFRHIGSRRKNTPRRAAEAGIICK